MNATTFNIGICEMSADLFVQSVKKGYDSKDFIEKLMKSETAKHLYNKTDTQMWRKRQILRLPLNLTPLL